MPGRNISSEKYRFGFNGKENDNEVKGNGNSLDFGARIYDSRLGRWLSVDPLYMKMPWMNPYHYSYDNPIYYLENNGNIPWPISKAKNSTGEGWNTKHGFWHQWRNYYNNNKGGYHQGVDINNNIGGNTDLGAPIYSTHDGKVVNIKLTTSGGNGREIIIQAPDGSFRSVYMHLQTISVKEGEEIKEGQQIGTLGGSGKGEELGYSAHLHYQLEKKNGDGEYESVNPESNRGVLIDPQDWIKKEGVDEDKGLHPPTGQTFIGPSPEKSIWQKIKQKVSDFFTGEDNTMPSSDFWDKLEWDKENKKKQSIKKEN